MADNDVIGEAFTELAPHYEKTMERELEKFLGLSYREFTHGLIEKAGIEESNVVLDLATGTAFLPRKIVDKEGSGVRVVGLDITPAMLEYGRKRIEAAGLSSTISLVCASAMDMPFGQGAFDRIICGFGMHHMKVTQVLSEMRHVFKRGGKLTLAAAGASRFWRSPWGRTLLRILLIYNGLSPKTARGRAEVEALRNLRTPDEWRDMLSDAGFTEIEVSESKARRAWYPCTLSIRAVAGGI